MISSMNCSDFAERLCDYQLKFGNEQVVNAATPAGMKRIEQSNQRCP